MPMPSPDDLAACRDLLRRGSQSFHAASLILPRRVRDPATALYAFCRVADDAVDQSRHAARAVALLRERLDRIYADRPFDTPVDRAFAAVVQSGAIPRAIPEALIEGFAWDAAGLRCPDIAALEAYAVRVAGTVGLMMALLMGRREEETLARAVDLGIAMQLGNVARDVGEDAAAGRLYLPLDWLAEEGVDPARFLSAPAPCEGVARVVARLLAHADERYERASAGIARLPADCRPAIHAARLVYREIGREVAARGFDSISGRAFVPGRRKAALLAQAVAAATLPETRSHGPTVPDGQALVRAAIDATPPRAARGFERLFDILTGLESRPRPVRTRLEPTR